MKVCLLLACLIGAVIPAYSAEGTNTLADSGISEISELSESTSKNAVRGILDLRDTAFSVQGNKPLSGQWEFYWNTLLSPAFFTNTQNSIGDVLSGYFDYPGVWNEYELADETLASCGFASFRLQVLLPEAQNQPLALKIPCMATAYRLWVNGREVAGNGRVGKSREASIPQHKRLFVRLGKANTNRLELLLHVANYFSDKGGPWNRLILGTEKSIYRQRDIQIFSESFVFGGIVFFGILNFLLFFFRKKQRAYLYLSIFCFVMSISYLFSAQSLVIHPDLPWQIKMRIEILASYFALPLFFTFIFYMFPRDVHKNFLAFTWVLTSILGILLLLFPITLSKITLPVYHLLLVSVCIYIIIMLFLLARKGKRGVLLILVGFTVMSVTIVNDILDAMIFLQTGYYLIWGTLFFVVLNSLALWLNYSHYFRRLVRIEIGQADKMRSRNISMYAVADKMGAAFIEAHRITKREKEIILLLIQGKTYKKIASDLHISLQTVKTHIYRIYRKLDVSDKSQLLPKIFYWNAREK